MIYIIHVVNSGETLSSIAKLYNTNYQKIASDNNININDTLVVGQTLVIEKENKIYNIEINGYTFPEINYNYLNELINYFTYISIFSYRINTRGDIYDIEDEKIIKITNKNKVLPIMVITNIGDNGRFNSDLVNELLNNEDSINNLINTAINNMKDKNYNILNVDFEYVYPRDKNKYIEFLNKIKIELEKYNYLLFVALAPKYSAEQQGTLYEAHDYHEIGKLANRVIIMTYEWGYTGGPAMAVAPIDKVRIVLNYAVSEMESNKILMGIPNYGYDWTLPFVTGASAKSLDNSEAVNIARKYKQSIKYDEKAQAPYFNYYDESMNKHEVWFEDARSIKAKLDLAQEYKLAGISYWTINRRFPQNYLVIKNNVNVAKYII